MGMPVLLPAVSFEAASASVRKARHVVREFLDCLVPPEALQAAVLLTSELATYSVQGSGRQFTVSACLAAAWLRVSLSDDDHRFPGLDTDNAGDGPDGLSVVLDVATEWGIEETVSGRRMWFELDLLSPALYTYRS